MSYGFMVRAGKQGKEMESNYCGRRGGVGEAYDTTNPALYYRPFIYGAPPRFQIWGRILGLSKIIRWGKLLIRK